MACTHAPVLITGFGAFGSVQDNPSGRVAEALDALGSIAGVPVRAELLRVAYALVDEALPRLVRELRPRAVISFGIDGKSKAVKLERFYLNIADAPPDVDGDERRGRTIEPGGPDAHRSTLPLERIHTALTTAGLPVEFSNHAGGYLCNYTGYRAAALVARGRGPRRSGFIHLPPVEALPLERQIEAARLAVEAVVAEERD